MPPKLAGQDTAAVPLAGLLSGNATMCWGQTARGFSFATALSQEIHKPWATVGLYTLATGTAWARVYQNRLWVSDVAVGAVVGIASAKLATG